MWFRYNLFLQKRIHYLPPYWPVLVFTMLLYVIPSSWAKVQLPQVTTLRTCRNMGLAVEWEVKSQLWLWLHYEPSEFVMWLYKLLRSFYLVPTTFLCIQGSGIGHHFGRYWSLCLEPNKIRCHNVVMKDPLVISQKVSLVFIKWLCEIILFCLVPVPFFPMGKGLVWVTVLGN